MNYDNKFANNTTNVVEPTQELWDNGIELRAEARSNVVNGVLQAISEKSLQTENTVAEKVVEIDTKLNRYDNIFTFVVDSQENFEKWLNNVRDNGEDYTSVLVKSGTWTATKGLNLTTAGTKVIEGQAGNKLQFSLSGEETGENKGIYYDTLPTGTEYRIDGLSIEVDIPDIGSDYREPRCYGFYFCSNLTNCQAIVSDSSSATYTSKCYGFYSCSNITNCKATTSIFSSPIYTKNEVVFYSCNNLTNCTGTSTSTYISTYTFQSCNNLTNCSGSGSGSGFQSCNNLTNCSGSGSGSGFRDCNNLTNCSGSGSGSGYGFYNCKQGLLNHGTADSCYSTKQESSTYAWADTPNGGFNDTTEWTP